MFLVLLFAFLIFAGCYTVYKGAKVVLVCALLWVIFTGGCGRRERYRQAELPVDSHVAAPLPLSNEDASDLLTGPLSHSKGW